MIVQLSTIARAVVSHRGSSVRRSAITPATSARTAKAMLDWIVKYAKKFWLATVCPPSAQK